MSKCFTKKVTKYGDGSIRIGYAVNGFVGTQIEVDQCCSLRTGLLDPPAIRRSLGGLAVSTPEEILDAEENFMNAHRHAIREARKLMKNVGTVPKG